ETPKSRIPGVGSLYLVTQVFPPSAVRRTTALPPPEKKKLEPTAVPLLASEKETPNNSTPAPSYPLVLIVQCAPPSVVLRIVASSPTAISVFGSANETA